MQTTVVPNDDHIISPDPNYVEEIYTDLMSLMGLFLMTTHFTVFILEGQCDLTLLTDSGKIRLCTNILSMRFNFLISLD